VVKVFIKDHDVEVAWRRPEGPTKQRVDADIATVVGV
jgi:hypothetical protein